MRDRTPLRPLQRVRKLEHKQQRAQKAEESARTRVRAQRGGGRSPGRRRRRGRQIFQNAKPAEEPCSSAPLQQGQEQEQEQVKTPPQESGAKRSRRERFRRPSARTPECDVTVVQEQEPIEEPSARPPPQPFRMQASSRGREAHEHAASSKLPRPIFGPQRAWHNETAP